MIAIVVPHKKQLNILIREKRKLMDGPNLQPSPMGPFLTPSERQHVLVLGQNKTKAYRLKLYVLKVQLSHIFTSDIMCLIPRRVVTHLMYIL